MVVRDGKHTQSPANRLKHAKSCCCLSFCSAGLDLKSTKNRLCVCQVLPKRTVPPPLYSSGISSLGCFFYWVRPVPSLLQAVEAAQLAEDLKVQLEHTQAKLKEIQVSVAENRTARERESSNLKRAQVCWGMSLQTILFPEARRSNVKSVLNHLFLGLSRRICPGWDGSWRNRKRWRFTPMLMRSCRKRSTSTRWERENTGLVQRNL